MAHTRKQFVKTRYAAVWTLAIPLFLSARLAVCTNPSLGEEVSPDTWSETIERFKGKYTLFTFWEVTCEPCIEEMPGLIEVYRELKPKGLEICSVNTDPEGRFEAAAKLSDKLDLPWVRLYRKPGPDTKFRQAVDPEYGANPFALLFDPNGNKVRSIAEAYSKEEWINLLEPYLTSAEKAKPPNKQPVQSPKDSAFNLSDVSILPSVGKGSDPSSLISAINLPGLPSSGAPGAPGGGNPFRMGKPEWTSKDPRSGTLTLPFRSDRPGHLLLGPSSLKYEKIKGKGVSVGDWNAADLAHLYMPISDMTEEVLYTPGSILLPIQVPAAPGPEGIEFQLSFSFQACTDGEGGLCYPPETYLLDGTLTEKEGRLDFSVLGTRKLDPWAPKPQPEADTVDSATASTSVTTSGTDSSADAGEVPKPSLVALIKSGDFKAIAETSLLLSFIVAFIGGILTSFTPCVYPMIPATVAIFGGKDVKSKFHSVSLAATYIMGVALSYASLGILAAALGTVFGQAMENPWVISVVAAFYVILALAMLDVFTFYLPSNWVTAATKVNRKGYTGAFLMGLVSSVVFAPCGEPILLSILLLVAKSQSFFMGFWWLFVYAWGIGVLFFVIAVFSSSIQYLPRAGSWMVAVKDFFGLLLFGLAIYWIHFVVSPSWTWGLTTVYLLGAATFIHVKNQDTSGWSRGVLSFVTLAAILFATLPLQKFAILQGWLPGSTALIDVVESKDTREGVQWLEETPLTHLAAAKAMGKPAVVDFRTDVCAKCDELEHYTFSDPKVREALEEFVTIQVNLSRNKEEFQEIQRENEILAVPVIEFYDSKGNRLIEKRIADFWGPEKFLDHIKDIG